MVEKKGIYTDVVNKTKRYFDGGMKQMWVRINGIHGKQAGEAGTVIDSLAHNGKMVSSNIETGVLIKHYTAS